MRVNRYAELLQLGCDLQRTASDLDRRNRGGRPELRCSAEDDDFRLVGVELEVVPQEPQPQSSRAVGIMSSSTTCGISWCSEGSPACYRQLVTLLKQGKFFFSFLPFNFVVGILEYWSVS